MTTRIRPMVRRAAAVALIAVAGVGIAAGPAAAAVNETCRIHFRTMDLARNGFMAAYDAWDQAGMDMWLDVYENAIDNAEAAGC